MKKWRSVLLFVGLIFVLGACTKLPQEQFSEALTAKQAFHAGDFSMTIDSFEMGEGQTSDEEANIYASMIMSQIVGTKVSGTFVQDQETEAVSLDMTIGFAGQDLPVSLIMDTQSNTAYVSADIYETLMGYVLAYGDNSYQTTPGATDLEGKFIRLDDSDLADYLEEDTTETSEAEDATIFPMLGTLNSDTFADYLNTLDRDSFEKDGDEISHTFTKAELTDYLAYAKEQDPDADLDGLQSMLDSVSEITIATTVNATTNKQTMVVDLVQDDAAQVALGMTFTFTGKESDQSVTIPAAEDVIDAEELFSTYDSWEDSDDDSYDDAETSSSEDWTSFMLTDDEFAALLDEVTSMSGQWSQEDIDFYLSFYQDYLTEAQYQQLVEALQVSQTL